MVKIWSILAVLFSGVGIYILISIVEYLKHRRRIKVTVGAYGIITSPPAINHGIRVIIKAINKGHRSITLTQAGLLLPRNFKEHYLVATDSVKIVELREGKSHSYYMDEAEVQNKCNLTASKYIAYVKDATEEFYWSHNRLNRLIKLGRTK